MSATNVNGTSTNGNRRRLTVAQALVRFLVNQYTERDGVERRLIAGCFGIFGHGNVAGVGQALLEAHDELRYFQARNEQAMVHTAVAYARMNDRLSTFACTSSVGPGATNMITGAALATINRIPVLLLPGDTFATRSAGTLLQELEDPASPAVSVNDCFRPVSRFWDRIDRPEQLLTAAVSAMRILTDPAETGAVTLALPEDVQTEGFDWPAEFFAKRVWRVRRPPPEPVAVNDAVELLRSAQRPLIVAGGGVMYSAAVDALRALVDATGIPVGETQAGKGALPYDHPCAAGAIGATGTTAANALAYDADVVLGVGTRWSDFTTASRSIFARAGVRFINLNVVPLDAGKNAGLPLVADARSGLLALRAALGDWAVAPDYATRVGEFAAVWDATVERAYAQRHVPLPSQSEIVGVVNAVSAPRDVVIGAAGSLPGDLHKLWRTRDAKGYHVEYGYSCMGYEIAGGIGVKLAAPDREVFVMVGDGSYLMMNSELVTAVQEGIKLNVVLIENHGFASIGGLSESVGSQRFGTAYRYRNAVTGRLDGATLPVDLAANAASLGCDVLRARTTDEFRTALERARASARTTVVYVETDPLAASPSSDAWWDVPVAEVSQLETTQRARERYVASKQNQRAYL
jgi:3D-(3,5/4)-trihydroxycyclohexane-1,2-dione acylhydrolase (decyclizing)